MCLLWIGARGTDLSCLNQQAKKGNIKCGLVVLLSTFDWLDCRVQDADISVADLRAKES